MIDVIWYLLYLCCAHWKDRSNRLTLKWDEVISNMISMWSWFIVKHIKHDYSTFSNFNQEEIKWIKWFMTDLLIKEWNNEELSDIIKITQLNNDESIMREENYNFFKNISNCQSSFMNEIYNLTFKYDELSSYSNKNKFFKLPKLNSKYWWVECRLICENWEKGANCICKIEFKSWHGYTSQNYYFKYYFWFHNCKQFTNLSEAFANYSAKYNL